MIISVDNNRYYTNISDESLIEKCKEFYKEGCKSYAVSFNNLPNWVIEKRKEKSFDVLLLKDFNNEYKFVPEEVKDLTTVNSLLGKGLTLVELQ